MRTSSDAASGAIGRIAHDLPRKVEKITLNLLPFGYSAAINVARFADVNMAEIGRDFMSRVFVGL